MSAPGTPLPPTGPALLPIASGRQTWGVVSALLRHRQGLLLGSVATLVVATIAGLLFPPIVGRITDTVLGGSGDASRIDQLAAALLLALFVRSAFSAWSAALVARLGETALASLREQVVERALVVPLADIERSGSGDLISRVGADVDEVSESTRDAVPALVVAVLTVGLTIVGLGVLDWRLALAGLAVVPVHAFTVRWYLRRSGPQYAAERIAVGARTQQLGETVSGARTIRAFGSDDEHIVRVERLSRSALTAMLRTARTGARFFALLNGAELVGTVAVLVVGFLAVRSGLITVGEATAAALYFHGLYNPIGMLLGLIDTVQDAAASLRRLVGVSSLAPPAEPPAPATPADSSLRLDGVRFAYAPGRDVLRGVDLALAPGERVALVGTSGAGKTTIATLVAGIHRPTAGTVRLGGATHDEMGPTAGSSAVLLVTQEVHVFAGPLSADLRLARPGASDDDLRTALRTVGADSWVDQLPEGLETVVGDGGHTLTMEQAQQLALARVALVEHPVVVLDEATAEAGSASARLLERSAQAAVGDRTALVIAHRLTQAVSADRIAVVADGRIIEQGPHDELAAGAGPYAVLWSAWSTSREATRRDRS